MVSCGMGGAYGSFDYESNMTWEQYFNSKYASDFKTYTDMHNCEADGIEPRIWYEIADDGDLILCVIADVYCDSQSCGPTGSDYDILGWDYIKVKLYGVTLQTKIKDTLDGNGFMLGAYTVPCKGKEPDEDDFKYWYYEDNGTERYGIIQASRHLTT